MIDHRLKSLLAGALVMVVAHGALAQETGGVRITGSVHNVTTVNDASNIARGSGSKAYMSIGSVGAGVEVDGDLEMHVDADRITNYAKGPGETAIMSIGSVHQGAKASGEVIVQTGDITNVSNGRGEASCVIIGSKGNIPECDQ
ncbi:MAG: hypothetical protein OEU92_32495 [Alphaproteobacteria bacterium]|nr:hypothetical protein [Alphaproteobacteria bacterium]